MTEAERQQVIDALNLAVLGSTTPRQLLICRQAHAIMQRDAQQHEELARLMREHDAGGS